MFHPWWSDPRIVDKLAMQADQFLSTWVANKAVYRTRMAIADGGELLIIAPGLERFGEKPEVDALIRRYGYTGTKRILDLYRTEADMQEIPHAARPGSYSVASNVKESRGRAKDALQAI